MSERKAYLNGKIFTSDPEAFHADAMIVEDGRIQWVGREEDIPSVADCTKVDLGGRRVLPGFVDAHMHPVMLADFSTQISALPPAVNSIEELTAAVAEFRSRQDGEQWIQGWGYDEGKFAEKRSPNRYDLDAGSPDAPVSILRTCGHIRCVNSRALEIAGITKDTPDPEGGEIERDEHGEPTGVLKENARNLITPFIPEDDFNSKVKNLTALGELLASQGIVAVADMGAIEKVDNYRFFAEAKKKGFRQEVAVYYFWEYYYDDPEFQIPAERLDRNRQIFVAGLKLIGDGSVSGRTAWMNEPYLGTNECGISVCTDEQIKTAIDYCKAHGLQLSVHAMGGKAIDRVLDFIYPEASWTPEDVPYVRIEHVTEPSESAVRKAAEKKVAFVTQPIFMYAEIESYLKNLGEERMRKCYPVRDMLDAGVHLSISTDAPATSWAVPSDPFPNIKSAVTRKAYDGTDCGRKQRIDVETAIRLYTKEAAAAAGFRETGQLKKGFKANFIILSDDIMTADPDEIDQIRVDETYIRGEKVYSRHGQN